MDFRATLNIIRRARNRNESSERSARNQRVMYAIREALVQFTNKPSTLNDIVSATRRILHPEPLPSKSTVWRVLRNSLQMRYKIIWKRSIKTIESEHKSWFKEAVALQLGAENENIELIFIDEFSCNNRK